MLIATKGDYGVRAMIDLARLNTGNPIARSAIATRRQIPEAYLDQLLGLLRRAGFINSVRGPGGGHSLAVDPKDITLFALLETLEGSLSPMANLDHEDQSTANDPTGQRWGQAEQAGIKRNLSTMILLVCDSMMHPGQTSTVFAVEPSNKLQHLHLASLPYPPRSVPLAITQQADPIALSSWLPNVPSVMLNEVRKGFTCEVRAFANQFV